MIRHYLTFTHQAEALDAALAGWALAECWSQEKNAMALRFVRGRESRFVEVSLDSRFGYALLRDEVHRARKNTIDFFGTLIGHAVVRVAIDDAERVVRFVFADARELAFFFFGGGGGNVLLLNAGVVEESFTRYDGAYDRMVTGGATSGQPEDASLQDVRAALQDSVDPPARALARAMPILGRRLAVEALHRAGLAGGPTLRDLSDAAIERLLETVDVLYGACEVSRRYYVYHLDGDAALALTELTSLAAEAVRTESFADIGDAVGACRAAWHAAHALKHERDRLLRRLTSTLNRLERARANRPDPEVHLERAAAWDRIGNLLMAGLHAIEKGAASVELADWETGENIVIELEAKLTPADNAARYFRKARGARMAAASARDGAGAELEMIERLKRLIAEVNDAGMKSLREIEQNNRDIFGMTAEPKEPGTAERFRRFEVSGGIEVFAGKNAANNDELTMRFARPNDYWLHARGSSGSHVVLRWNDSKTKPPKDALRQAASIAAYYSGGRGAKMVPVAYTLKKHVRKPRGAAPGAVVMEREDVIMAEPKLPG